MTDLVRALVNDLGQDPEALDRLAELLAPRMTTHAPTPAAEASERLLTWSEAAQRTGTHVETIRRAVRSGALPAGRAGRSPRIAPADLETWLAGGEGTAQRTSQLRARRVRGTRNPLGDAFASMERRDGTQIR